LPGPPGFVGCPAGSVAGHGKTGKPYFLENGAKEEYNRQKGKEREMKLKSLNDDGQIRCVIYDCDGVILDSFESNRRFYNYFRTALGQPPLTEEELKFAHTHTSREALRFLFRNDSDLEDRAQGLLSRVDPLETIAYLKLEPNVLSTLDTLKGKGVIRAISTNRANSMKYVMEKFNLQPYFELVVTALDVKNPKPNPESVEKIIRTFSLKEKETVLVGDSEIDRQAALAAGVKFIAYKNKEIHADAFIEDHLAILDLLFKGGSRGEEG
jgi:phosphoglycolate phosphatase